MIRDKRICAPNGVNVLAKWGAVASLKDKAAEADVKAKIIDMRNKTSKVLESYGYPVIPSQTNFFMVSLHDKMVQPTIQAFREKNILVGRPFPPMLNHLRVSIGRDEDMAGAAIYLASRAGDYVMGDTIAVDGGIAYANLSPGPS